MHPPALRGEADDMKILSIACATSLLLGPGTAQQRLFEAHDLDARKLAASHITDALQADADLLTTVALAATGGTALPSGSAARAELTRALQRAHRDANRVRARSRLRLDLDDLLEQLSFRIVREADLPQGFPTPTVVGELELRRYPRYRMARTAMGPGGGNAAFWPLFQHIKTNRIAMTAPVQTDYAADASRKRARTMAFLYGDPSTRPDTVDQRVEVVDVDAITVLSVGAIGVPNEAALTALERRLRAWVAAHDDRWQVAGPLRTMGYNSPMVGRSRNYFEVQLPIRAAERSDRAAVARPAVSDAAGTAR